MRKGQHVTKEMEWGEEVLHVQEMSLMGIDALKSV